MEEVARKEELHVSDPSGDTEPWPCVFPGVGVCARVGVVKTLWSGRTPQRNEKRGGI